MTEVASCLAFLAPIAAAMAAARASTSIRARDLGFAAMLVSLVASLAPLVAGEAGREDPWAAALPAFVSAIGLTAVAMSPAHITGVRTFSRILIVTASSIAMVVTQHPVGLAIVWCVSAIPVWSELRERADTRASARVFAAYMLPSTAFVLAGGAMLGAGMTSAAVLPLAAGIAIREAVVPFHSWFPSFLERAPMGLAVVFVAPQLGVYAHLRWLSAGLPLELRNAVAALGVVTVVFAAAMGAVQTRARRALGYLMMSQTALVAFGLENDSALGRSGALASWLVCGLAMAGLAMTLAALEARRGALTLAHPSGSLRRVPSLAGAYLLLGLAGVGLPGTLGFVAEDLLVQGSVETFPVLGLVLIAGTALNGVTVVRSFFVLFMGSRRHSGERDLTLRERLALTVVLATLIVTGIAPRIVVPWLRDTAHAQERER
ncbi:MAG: proton-conducting transporter membrane subunit [Sandaracinaceae bacterium]|nr:proton-conducting transporter membrane subunit [Sandaracinaceae bacterium]